MLHLPKSNYTEGPESGHLGGPDTSSRIKFEVVLVFESDRPRGVESEQREEIQLLTRSVKY